jgi:hypothetical protein
MQQMDFIASLMTGKPATRVFPGMAAAEPKKTRTAPQTAPLRPTIDGTNWIDMTDLARTIGFRTPVAAAAWLTEWHHTSCDHLYDAMWLAWYTMQLDSLDRVKVVVGTPETMTLRLEAVTIDGTVYIGRADDF